MTVRDTAIKLRKLGYSYTYISNKTGLAKSTLSYHLSQIHYKPNKITVESIGRARAQSGLTKARAKKQSYIDAKKLAKSDVGRISKRDLFMLGLGVYIGEGSKTHDIIRVVNTDYRVINLFINWLCSVGYTKENFFIRLHLYPDSDVVAAETFWKSKTGLPHDKFQKVCIDRRVIKDKKKSGKYIHGTAHVTVHAYGQKTLGVAFSRRIGAWMKEVLE